MDLVVQWHCLATVGKLLAFHLNYEQMEEARLSFQATCFGHCRFKIWTCSSPHHLHFHCHPESFYFKLVV